MILEKVKHTIDQFAMLEKGERVIVGVSGGPDSMALLCILSSLIKKLDIELFVAHLNHMIRKTASARDALFVKKEAEKLGLPFFMEAKDIPRMAKDLKLSIEEAARMARYDFYYRLASEVKADKIALGHTEDDQAETILMRLIRGAGLLGLSGIPPTRKLGNKLIIRPLIEISKAEIKNFLNEKGVSFREDESNLKPIYFRNKIRQKLIPFLEKEFSQNIKNILNDTGKNLRIDYEYLLRACRRKFIKYARCTKGKVAIQLGFTKEDLAIQRMIIREAMRKAKGNLNSVTYRHWGNLNKLLKKKTIWSMVFPGGILVRRNKNDLIFTKPEEKRSIVAKNAAYYELKIPGCTKIPEIKRTIKASFVKRPPQFLSKKSKNVEWFDFDKLNTPVFIRFKKSKDIFRPLGMKGHKRLKRLFIDEKIAFEKREKVPLVFSGNRIIWVCGVKRSDCAKITNTTKRVLNLKII